ncbi:hypothetical protein E2C01_015371 [Portunus trituberculatus]|uniref:Uncharacterized protein n=1 Tax=Portunus trituberculatus TaxID=210409 RepID=A0A5B7DMJ8_PORTR|nr:hypothetical protein [Portunus trituberculatus]
MYDPSCRTHDPALAEVYILLSHDRLSFRVWGAWVQSLPVFRSLEMSCSVFRGTERWFNVMRVGMFSLEMIIQAAAITEPSTPRWLRLPTKGSVTEKFIRESLWLRSSFESRSVLLKNPDLVGSVRLAVHYLD